MTKHPNDRPSLEAILASCSDILFPDELGEAPVVLDSRGFEDDTPLHVMLWRGDTYAALELIKAGADVNAVGDMSETPLHVAIGQQNLAAVEAMLNAGADTSHLSEFGQTPKDLAREVGGEVCKLVENHSRK